MEPDKILNRVLALADRMDAHWRTESTVVVDTLLLLRLEAELKKYILIPNQAVCRYCDTRLELVIIDDVWVHTGAASWPSRMDCKEGVKDEYGEPAYARPKEA